jgi:hypothetical protein
MVSAEWIINNSSIQLVMTADVKQDFLFFGNKEGQGNPVAVSEADGVTAGELAAQGVELQVGLKGVFLQVGDDFNKTGFQVRMLPEELARLMQKLVNIPRRGIQSGF